MARVTLSKLALSALLVGAAAGAQAADKSGDYPSRAVTIVSPYSPGGTNDLVSRVLASELSKESGATFIVENKPGANGSVGASAVARSNSEGYMLLMANGATHGTNPTLYGNRLYDAVKDFTPVGMVAEAPNVVVVGASQPYKTLQEFIDAAKRDPGKLAFGHSGVGGTGHLSGEKFQQVTGTQLLQVPYKGEGPVVSDLVTGQIPAGFLNISSVLAQTAAGNLRVLAVFSKQRTPILPDVPTAAELGIKDFEFSVWLGLAGPADMPKASVDKLNAMLNGVLETPEMGKRLAALGSVPVITTPEECEARFTREIAKYKAIIDSIHLKLDQ